MTRTISIRRNTCFKRPRICLVIYYICAILVIAYGLILFNRYIFQPSPNVYFPFQIYPAYNTVIQANGIFLQNPGYKILQMVKHRLSDKFTEFHDFLQYQDELKQYFTLVPRTSYHITLADFRNNTNLTKESINELQEEQKRMDKYNTTVNCDGKDIFIIHTSEIRMTIELDNAYVARIKRYHRRWSKKFPEIISNLYTPFYITIGYQYKNLPNVTVLKEFSRLLRDWEGIPFDIELDSITICSYQDAITYEPILHRKH
ncbi:unnamed protein product [Rotaria socialis]|uniref:DUF1868 domain-containing protein n=1 Tax=Rotaria socialis TaxID=392032 RepID=A0A820TIT7_9BILA|nr:unnamed protein product [Rotaria socialis]CAF3701107.1 unnamed protein product [Rotaria socialis]CAF4248598.1 unnamed protein product [Rotaria socialis]CAF4466953.1 unnamed protein product [Rotaria socialis]